MDDLAVSCAARDLSARLLNEQKQNRLRTIDFDHIRAAVAGYALGHNVGTGSTMTWGQITDLETQTQQLLKAA